MISFCHRLHRSIVKDAVDRRKVEEKLRKLSSDRLKRRLAPLAAPVPGGALAIELSTVSKDGTFDAWVDIQFDGGPANQSAPMIVDSGNTVLVVPRWEDIQGLSGYTLLGQVKYGPFNSVDVNVVEGPILIPTQGGGVLRIPNCIFYACTCDPRVSNFGVGCVTPWSAGSSNALLAGAPTLQSPLSYLSAYPCVEFLYQAGGLFGNIPEPVVSGASLLNLYPVVPDGYTMMGIFPNYGWMSVAATSLGISGATTAWPGAAPTAIAMVDTGGGPVFVTDPNNLLANGGWAPAATCPSWMDSSTACQCIAADLEIELADPNGGTTFFYAIKPGTLPASAQGLTAIMCEENVFLRSQYGMNIGGLSLLFASVVIDYASNRVGFKLR
ncbi:MAG TPA: hypothetical protein VGL42_03605 [Opitutaceae bacterium]|jgi:hypothetical protein